MKSFDQMGQELQEMGRKLTDADDRIVLLQAENARLRAEIARAWAHTVHLTDRSRKLCADITAIQADNIRLRNSSERECARSHALIAASKALRGEVVMTKLDDSGNGYAIVVISRPSSVVNAIAA